MLDTFKHALPEALAAIREEMEVRRTKELFLLCAMGSQFDHLIYQVPAKLGVYCIVGDPASMTVDDVRTLNPTGIIISGGPASVHAEPPPFDQRIFDLGIPVFGICLGAQMMAQHVGARVVPGTCKEFGEHEAYLTVPPHPLFAGCPNPMPVLESHGDEIITDTEHFERGIEGRLNVLASVDHGIGKQILAAFSYQNLFGVQFHPECTETTYGEKIFENFIFGICKAKDRFPAEDVAAKKIAELKRRVGPDKKVLLALSGGSDSSTVAYLLKHAIGDKTRLRGVYIKGVDRPDDEAFVLKYFANQDWIDLKIVDATERFKAVLRGKHSIKEKRVAMRVVYKVVLEEEAALFGADFIAQGTLYTDISESGGGHASGARKAQIKLHHNTNLGFSLPELTPLDDCVKDNGRNIGRAIGVPEELLMRHPFPGPGLLVRDTDEITGEKLAMLRQLDGIYIEELRNAGHYEKVWQAGASTLTPGYVSNWEVHNIFLEELRKAGLDTQFPHAYACQLLADHTYTKGDDAGSGPVIMLSAGDTRPPDAELPWDFLADVQRRICNEVPGIGAVCYELSSTGVSASKPTLLLWAVWSVNGFTARAAQLPKEFLADVTQRVRREVPEVGAICYRISNKPISTIEIG